MLNSEAAGTAAFLPAAVDRDAAPPAIEGEHAHMLFSLVAKTLIAWHVFAGTLRP
jgi:hypothetical protein